MYTQLRELRYNRGLSQEGLAAELGLSQATIFKWERGEVARPKPNTAKKLVDFFEVPLATLLAPEQKKAPTADKL